jgi:hypothetical protein
MKNDDKDRTRTINAIKSAESLVRSEMRLTNLAKLNAPPTIISEEREVVGGRMADIISDDLAQQILPQARQILLMREMRVEYLHRNTLLGKCHDHFDTLFNELAHSCDIDVPCSTVTEALKILENAIRSNHEGEVACALLAVLEFVMHDLTFRAEELPPLPPAYRLPVSR